MPADTNYEQFIVTLRSEIAKYAFEASNCIGYFTENTVEKVFAISVIPENGAKLKPFISLFVRVVADSIIIEEDRNNKPLVDALVQAGIPREKVILAYAGEKVPDTSV